MQSWQPMPSEVHWIDGQGSIHAAKTTRDLFMPGGLPCACFKFSSSNLRLIRTNPLCQTGLLAAYSAVPSFPLWLTQRSAPRAGRPTASCMRAILKAPKPRYCLVAGGGSFARTRHLAKRTAAGVSRLLRIPDTTATQLFKTDSGTVMLGTVCSQIQIKIRNQSHKNSTGISDATRSARSAVLPNHLSSQKRLHLPNCSLVCRQKVHTNIIQITGTYNSKSSS